jgi:hypothetical protein
MPVVYSRPNPHAAKTQTLDYTTRVQKQAPLVNTDPLSEEKIVKALRARQASEAATDKAQTNYKAVLTAEEQAIYDQISAPAVLAPVPTAPTSKVD